MPYPVWIIFSRILNWKIEPAEGLWIDNDSFKYYNVNSGFYVVAPYIEDSIKYFEDYKTILKKRFSQRYLSHTPGKNIIL
jgi:hypothetical protein